MRIAQNPQPRPEKEWTLLFYHAGDSNMGQTATAHLLNLERVGSDDNVDIVCLNDQRPWLRKDVPAPATYHVTRQPDHQSGWLNHVPAQLKSGFEFMTADPQRIQSPVIQQHGADFDSGKAANLKQFLLENMERFPARHYGLIMTGHGGGLLGQAVVGDSRITNDDLGDVLDQVAQSTGHKLDLVNLDTCYGAGLETLFPLRKGAGTVVASQASISTATQPMAQVVESLQNSLKAGATVSGAELGQRFVEASRQQPLSNFHTPTLSAMDASKLEDLGQAVARLHSVILDSKVDPAVVCQALENAQKFDYGSVPRTTHLYDLGSVASELVKLAPNHEVSEAAQAVSDLVGQVVIAEQHQDRAHETLATRAVRLAPGMEPFHNLDGARGITMHYDTDVHTEGDKLKFIRGTQFGELAQSESFFGYLSQVAEQKSDFKKFFETHTRSYKKWERDLQRSIGIPFVVPAAKLALGVGAMGLAGLGLGLAAPVAWAAAGLGAAGLSMAFRKS